MSCAAASSASCFGSAVGAGLARPEDGSLDRPPGRSWLRSGLLLARTATGRRSGQPVVPRHRARIRERPPARPAARARRLAGGPLHRARSRRAPGRCRAPAPRTPPGSSTDPLTSPVHIPARDRRRGPRTEWARKTGAGEDRKHELLEPACAQALFVPAAGERRKTSDGQDTKGSCGRRAHRGPQGRRRDLRGRLPRDQRHRRGRPATQPGRGRRGVQGRQEPARQARRRCRGQRRPRRAARRADGADPDQRRRRDRREGDLDLLPRARGADLQGRLHGRRGARPRRLHRDRAAARVGGAARPARGPDGEPADRPGRGALEHDLGPGSPARADRRAGPGVRRAAGRRGSAARRGSTGGR